MAMKALGIIEAIGLNTAIVAADAAVKSANVELLGYENGKGGGRITVKLIGDVGAVQAAIAAAKAAGGQLGKIESAQVIARPHDDIAPLINTIDRGKKKAETKVEVKAAPAAPPPVSAPAAPTPAPAPEATPAPAPQMAPPTKPNDEMAHKPKGKK